MAVQLTACWQTSAGKALSPFTPMPAASTSARSVPVRDFESEWPPHPTRLRPLQFPVCQASGLVSGFLQIPSQGGHPLPFANRFPIVGPVRFPVSGRERTCNVPRLLTSR